MGWSLVIILITALFSAGAQAYPTPVDLDGKLHRWPVSADAPNVYFEISVSDESLKADFLAITTASADIWSSVDNSLLKVKPVDGENSAQITVYFESSIAGGDMAAGYSIFDEVDEGTPKHCSIHIAADASTDLYYLSKTTLHELGHCLGLGHSLVPVSIMSYKLDQNSFALGMDDKAAIARLYPFDGSGAKLAPGCAIGKTRSSLPQPSVIFILFLIPAIFSITRKIMNDSVKN